MEVSITRLASSARPLLTAVVAALALFAHIAPAAAQSCAAWKCQGEARMPALARWIAFCIAVLTGLAAPAGAQSKYPEKPVHIVLAYGPGGVADVTTRLVAQKLSESMGQ